MLHGAYWKHPSSVDCLTAGQHNSWWDIGSLEGSTEQLQIFEPCVPNSSHVPRHSEHFSHAACVIDSEQGSVRWFQKLFLCGACLTAGKHTSWWDIGSLEGPTKQLSAVTSHLLQVLCSEHTFITWSMLIRRWVESWVNNVLIWIFCIVPSSVTIDCFTAIFIINIMAASAIWH